MKIDFYYSRKLEKLCQEHYGDQYVQGHFNGIPFTEWVGHGKEPRTLEMGDLILIGTGTIEDIQIYDRHKWH